MNATSLLFDPWLPVPVLILLGGIGAALLAVGAVRRARGIAARAGLLVLLLLLLAGPTLKREERRPLPNLVLLVEDATQSQELDLRPEQRARTLAGLRERLQALRGVEVQELRIGDDPLRGTALLSALRETLLDLDRDRLAAVLVVSDGQVHDAEVAQDLLPEGVPFHLLLTGRADERDRSLEVLYAPTFAIVGEPQEVRVRIRDRPRPLGASARLRLRRDGELLEEREVRVGDEVRLSFRLEKAGRSALELEVEAAQGELTERNNRAVVFVNGVRDRLRVLLVSGLPHQGLRVWRNLLKADPSVDLVHFTILRPPEKQDGTPVRELALIAFPTRELFELKLKEFDLIIFDRYMRRGLLPLVYLDNIARYVEEGGALLEAAGPEFASPYSLYRTPLSRVLPGRPTGEVFEAAFKPMLTDLGRRHPVTRGLMEQDDRQAEPSWGRWLRQVDVEPRAGDVLMSGFAGRPLLILDRVGKGRVAQLLSDQAWLWARGFEGGGPQGPLLRRLVHWLMQEPELEEEALVARAEGDSIVVERLSLAPEPVVIEVESPSGERTRYELTPDDRGIARLRIPGPEPGLYRIQDGERTVFAAARPVAEVELRDPVRSAEPLRPLVEASGGTVVDLAQSGVPELRLVGSDRRTFGRGWIGVRDRERAVVEGATRIPLLPPPLALALALGLLGFAWWREGRA